MLTESHRANSLSDDERATFERDGFLHVPGALDATDADELERAVDAIVERHRSSGFDPYTDPPFDPDKAFFYPNFLGRGQVFVNLLDCVKTFPKVCDILGWNIYCYHTHFIVTPPRPAAARDERRFGFHQDSGRVNAEIESHPRPRLSVKIVYWLSDLRHEDGGNLWVVPGSHLRDDPPVADRSVEPPDAVPVCGERRDALIFDRRLWHSSSANDSAVTRKALFYGYGYRWLRPKDDMTIPADVMRNSDPVRRQLLGWSPDNNRRFSPRDGDTPLKDWLEG